MPPYVGLGVAWLCFRQVNMPWRWCPSHTLQNLVRRCNAPLALFPIPRLSPFPYAPLPQAMVSCLIAMVKGLAYQRFRLQVGCGCRATECASQSWVCHRHTAASPPAGPRPSLNPLPHRPDPQAQCLVALLHHSGTTAAYFKQQRAPRSSIARGLSGLGGALGASSLTVHGRALSHRDMSASTSLIQQQQLQQQRAAAFGPTSPAGPTGSYTTQQQQQQQQQHGGIPGASQPSWGTGGAGGGVGAGGGGQMPFGVSDRLQHLSSQLLGRGGRSGSVMTHRSQRSGAGAGPGVGMGGLEAEGLMGCVASETAGTSVTVGAGFAGILHFTRGTVPALMPGAVVPHLTHAPVTHLPSACPPLTNAVPPGPPAALLFCLFPPDPFRPLQATVISLSHTLLQDAISSQPPAGTAVRNCADALARDSMPIRDLTLACRLCDPKLGGGAAAFEHSLTGYDGMSGGFAGGGGGTPASSSFARRGGGGGGPAPLGSLVIALGMAGGEACRSMRVMGGGPGGAGAGGQGVRTSAMATARFSGMGPDTQGLLFLPQHTSTNMDVHDYDHVGAGALAGGPSGRPSLAAEASLPPSRTAALAAGGGGGGGGSSQAASSLSARAALAAAESPATSSNQAAAVAAVLSSGGGGNRRAGGSPPLRGATHGTATTMASEHGGGFGVGLGGIGEGFREGEAAAHEEQQEPLLALYLGFREVLQESVLERVLEEMTQVVEVSGLCNVRAPCCGSSKTQVKQRTRQRDASQAKPRYFASFAGPLLPLGMPVGDV